MQNVYHKYYGPRVMLVSSFIISFIQRTRHASWRVACLVFRFCFCFWPYAEETTTAFSNMEKNWELGHVYGQNCFISNQNDLLFPTTWTLVCFLGTDITHPWMRPNATSPASCCPEICPVLCHPCTPDQLLRKDGRLHRIPNGHSAWYIMVCDQHLSNEGTHYSSGISY